MSEYRLEYPSVGESESAMLDAVSQIMKENAVDPEDSHRIMLIVSEAFTNAMVHGNKNQPDKTIIIRIRINEKRISADITDQGQNGIARIRCKNPHSLLSESGRGIDLIRHYASEVKFQESETGGLTVVVNVTRNKWQKNTIEST